MRQFQGFSLIELMITVSIVAIVSAIAIPSYVINVQKAEAANLLTVASDMQRQVEEALQESSTDFNTTCDQFYNQYVATNGGISYPNGIMAVISNPCQLSVFYGSFSGGGFANTGTVEVSSYPTVNPDESITWNISLTSTLYGQSWYEYFTGSNVGTHWNPPPLGGGPGGGRGGGPKK